MTTHSDDNAENEEREPDDDLLEKLYQFDQHIQEGLQGDARLDSGVPESARGSDLDFIQMSGLTAPPPAEDQGETPAPAPESELDASKPVSFFEKGVADVDATMVPGLEEEREAPPQETTPVVESRAAMAHLRDMIAELTKDEAELPPLEELAPEPVKPLEPELPEVHVAAQEEAPEPQEVLAEFVETPPPALPEPEPEPVVEAEAAEPERGESDMVIVTPEAFPSGQYVSAEDLALRSEVQAEPEPPAPPRIPEDREEKLAEATWAKAEERREPARRAPEPAPSLTAFSQGARIYAPPPEPAPRVVSTQPSAKEREPLETPEGIAKTQGPVGIPSIAEAEEAMYLRDHGKKRRRSGHRKHARRRIFRMLAAAIVVCALGVGLYEAYTFYEQRVANPASLYNDAVSLLAKGDVLQAADKFGAFAARNPDSPMKPDAQFAAAFALQQWQSQSRDELNRIYERSLALFTQFVNDNPTHPKAPRAAVLMGRLHYELGQYREAIELLKDPELRLRDPMAAVPALRILARSCAKLGQDESARSYYMQSVGHQDNHAPDVDYMELGSLYRTLTDQASSPDSRKKYAELALAQWTYAAQAPGIDPESKRELRSKIEALRQRESLGESTPVTDGVPPVGQTDGTLAQEIADPGVGESVPWEVTAPAIEPGTSPASPAPSEEAPEVDETVIEPAAEETETESATHTVSAGDTLSAIAGQHGVTVEQLMQWNGLSGSTIFVGQELVLQDPGVPASELDATANEGV